MVLQYATRLRLSACLCCSDFGFPANAFEILRLVSSDNFLLVRFMVLYIIPLLTGLVREVTEVSPTYTPTYQPFTLSKSSKTLLKVLKFLLMVNFIEKKVRKTLS